jgi:hypothetical protein
MVTQKVHALSKNEAFTILNNFFESFPTWCTQSTQPTVSDLEKCLSRNFQLTSNEEPYSKNITDYLNRIVKLRKKYSSFDVTGPLEEPFISDNKIVVQYELNLRTHSGKNSQVYIIAIGTIEDHKFTKWTQVTHEKGTSQWDA